MTEPLKGTVSYGITVNLGNYNSQRFDATFEFYLDEMTYPEAFEYVKKQVEQQREIKVNV